VTSRSSRLGDIPNQPWLTDPRLDFAYSAATLKTRNPPFPAGFEERMKGLEPSTFCMARTLGAASVGDSRRQTRMVMPVPMSLLCHEVPPADAET
jgi:hypothetical protein